MAKNTDIPVTHKDTQPTDDLEARIAAAVEKRVKEALAKTAMADRPAAIDNTDIKKLIAESVSQSLTIALPQVAQSIGQGIMAAQQATKMGEHEQNLAARKAKLALEEKCHICRQSVGDGIRRGCGGPWARSKDGSFVMEKVLNPDGTEVLDGEGKPVMRRVERPEQFHVLREVRPSDPVAAEWFMGIKLNGALYFSQGPGHKVWVPKNTDIDSILSVYTQNELEQRVGRKHNRANGGTLNGRTGGHSGPPVGAGFN